MLSKQWQAMHPHSGLMSSLINAERAVSPRLVHKIEDCSGDLDAMKNLCVEHTRTRVLMHNWQRVGGKRRRRKGRMAGEGKRQRGEEERNKKQEMERIMVHGGGGGGEM